MDAPKANNLHLYIRELKKQNVVCVVRVCEPTYLASEVEAAGIEVSARLAQERGSNILRTKSARYMQFSRHIFGRNVPSSVSRELPPYAHPS